MSTISLSNIETANGSEPLTLRTGNTSGPSIVLNTNGSIDFISNTIGGISTISLSNIETANGSEPLTLRTGNTNAGDIVINPTGGVVISPNSSVNSIIISTGSIANTLVTNATGVYISSNTSPSVGNTYDLGTNTLRWRNIYTQDLHLNNGIGDYTIVEGEEDLFLYNNKNGKIYKFLVQEVDPTTAPEKSKWR